jgi:hypothetical protein
MLKKSPQAKMMTRLDYIGIFKDSTRLFVSVFRVNICHFRVSEMGYWKHFKINFIETSKTTNIHKSKLPKNVKTIRAHAGRWKFN